ncbi:MAG: A/G-specific adenine glycosylase [Ignavibacteria bacterium]|nr:A/G-specific adenine glycosylase [Ignavibacteria bacterium]MBI3765995.1 A/G-specific adenine glycosylase [Ignavibacteriales bacterium]
MRKFHRRTIKALHRNVLRWYRKHQRQLFWRSTRDPYEILVSEIMLQQTQASRVQEKLPQFLDRFPTLRTLAHASRADVIRAWRGMGYNNRAVRLRELARKVIERHEGQLPCRIEELLRLPGIGKYTAHALTCFAYGRRMPVVDVNIRRVLSRVLWKTKSTAELRTDDEIWSAAERILPKDSYSWNQALMDLGATVCTARRPKCEECPIASICSSRHLHKLGVMNGRQAHQAKKMEPRYNGIPHRIWRGRIVEALRNMSSESSFSLVRLGHIIKSDFSKRELPWLSRLIDGLVRDGIAHTSKHRSTISVMLAGE